MLASVAEFVIPFVVIAALVAAAVWAFRSDPHWVSKDGERFICRGRELDPSELGKPQQRAAATARSARTSTRWKDQRGYLDGGAVVISPRGLTARRGNHRYPKPIETGADDKGRVLFLLENSDRRLVLRVPPTSKLVGTLRSIAGR